MRNEYVVVQLYGYRGLSEKEYWYHTFFDVKEGDEVVVESMYRYAVGRVKGRFKELSKGTDFEILEVVEILDTSKVKKLREREERKNRLRAEMRSIIQNVEEEELFSLLAKEIPNMEPLYTEYRDLLQECDR